jgi:hypothetical protein
VCFSYVGYDFLTILLGTKMRMYNIRNKRFDDLFFYVSNGEGTCQMKTLNVWNVSKLFQDIVSIMTVLVMGSNPITAVRLLRVFFFFFVSLQVNGGLGIEEYQM